MVKQERHGELAVITIDRPEARNAISRATMDEIEVAIDECEGARAVVITGGGDRAFVSGGDLKELSAIRTVRDAGAMAARMRGLCDRLSAFPGAVIAALNGHALGGGAELAVAADIRIAADDVKIGFNQVSLAIMPAWGGAERLGALVGPGRALLLAGSGRILTAAEAERWGLIDVVVPRAEFEAGWRQLGHDLANRPAQEIKRVIRGGGPAGLAVQAFAELWVDDAHWAAADKVMRKA